MESERDAACRRYSKVFLRNITVGLYILTDTQIMVNEALLDLCADTMDTHNG
jgi:hypothetical protein